MKKGVLLLTIFWLGLIGWFSSQTLQASTNQTYSVLEKLNLASETELIQSGTEEIRLLKFLTRKSAHFFLFFMLGTLIAVSTAAALGWEGKVLLLRSWAIGSAFGVADEIHQYFIPGRAMTFTDMVIDSAGVLAGVLVTLWVFEIFKAWKESRQEAYQVWVDLE